MRKVTARAHPDVALIKYWGKKDARLRLPENDSLSLILEGLSTTTTVELDESLTADDMVIDGEAQPAQNRTSVFLDLIREKAGVQTFVRVVSKNSFPAATGLSSSGSGFAALTLAATEVYGLQADQKELSRLARKGSGTACRCMCSGVVQWYAGEDEVTSFSETVYPADQLDIVDVVAVVDAGKKAISSTEGHGLASSSPLYAARQEHLPAKMAQIKQAFAERDFEKVGLIAEQEALEFHSILLTSQPSLLLLYPGSVAVMHQVRQLRQQGIPAFFTINTGHNVHVLTQSSYSDQVKSALESMPEVAQTIVSAIGDQPVVTSDHLF